MKSYEQIAEAMYKKWQAALISFRKPMPFHQLEAHEQQAWIAAAQVAHKEMTELTTPEESTKPYPTTDLNAGLSVVYITVRAGEAQCQQAIPREIVSNMRYPEQLIGGIVLKQIKIVDSIIAAAKENK